MSADTINARDWVFQVHDGASTWIDIAGIKKFALKPGENEESADTTDFNSEGEHESQAMQRGASISVEGQFLLTEPGNVRNPGQLRVDALGALKGKASLGQIRFRHEVQTLWTVWTAWVSLGERGGENNDKTAWAVTFNKSGAATTAAVV
jgi:hypothetical protein